MSFFDTIDRRRVAWCVVINGLPYRFCSELAPGGLIVDGRLYDWDGALVQTPVDLLDSVLSVGPIEADLDELSGVADQSPVVVTIRAQDVASAGTRVHPFETLMRTAGPPSAERALKLAATIAHDVVQGVALDIAVAKSAAAWTLPGPVHIGHEVLWADGFSDPGGGVHLLTGCTRGADLYVTQEHVVSAREFEQPWVTSEVTAWHGRRAAIYVSAILNDGTAAGWSQYWAGYLDSAPEMAGDVITIRIAPLTRVMSYTLGVGTAARTARSVGGAHRFRVGVGDRIDARIRWQFSAVSLRATIADIPAHKITLHADDAAALATFGRLDSVSFGAPGQGGAPEVGELIGVTLVFAAASPLVAMVDAALTLGAATEEVLMSGAFSEHFPLRLVDPTGAADQIVSWPERLGEVVNEAQAWQPGPIESWADPEGAGGEDRIGRLRLQDAGMWILVGQMREGLSGMPGTPGLIGAGAGLGDVAMMRGGRNCWAGFIAGEGVGDVQGSRASDGRRAANVSKAFDGQAGFADGGLDPTRWPIDGPAAWWYQSGEPWIGPFDVNVYTGAGARQQIRLTIGDFSATMWVEGYTSAVHPESDETVYWYEVVHPDAQQSVVQMDGGSPVECQVVAGANDVDPPQYLVRLIASGVGNGDNGGSDVMPIGANVPASHIDGASFAAMASPGSLMGQNYTAVRGKSIIDQAEGMLLACGAHVVSAYSAAANCWQIALADNGPADAALSVITLTDDDMVPGGKDGPVRTTTDGRVARSYTVTLNYPAFGVEGDPVTVPVSAGSERNDGGADSGEPLEIDLPGVRVVGDGGLAQAAAEIVADVRARVGVPRQRWTFSIRADMPGALSLGVGDVVTLTSSWAIAVRPTAAVASIPCRIVSFKRDLTANKLTLGVRPFQGLPGGWAPSARVATVIDADSVTVEAASFSADDASWIAAGDELTGIAPGDWAGRVSLTVATVSGVTVNFTGAHSLAVGDLLRTQDYATAVAVQQVWAFLSDSDDELGGEPGRIIG